MKKLLHQSILPASFITAFIGLCLFLYHSLFGHRTYAEELRFQKTQYEILDTAYNVLQQKFQEVQQQAFRYESVVRDWEINDADAANKFWRKFNQLK